MKAARTLLALSSLALAGSGANAQTIETVAGGGPGDGSPALAVNLRTPQDVIRDGAGNTYVAVSDDRRVYRIKADGTIELVAGSGGSGSSGDGGPAVKAELVSPKGLAFDTDGNLLIADEGGRRVRRVALAAGKISTLIGGGTFTGEGIPALQIVLDAPRDIVVASSGDVLIADGHRVRRLDRASGLVGTAAGTGTSGFSDGSPAATKRLNEPRALAFDPAGSLLIADGGNGRIRKLDLATDTISTLVSGVCSPGGVAVDAAGVVYLSSNAGSCGANAQKLLKWTSGTLSSLVATGSSYVAQISVLAGGTLLAADRDNFRLKSVTPGGASTVIAGNGTMGYYGHGVAALASSMLSPTHVRADAAGNIFVYDNTNRIRRVTTAGIDVTVAATANCGSDPHAFLCSIEGIAILPGGALALSESKNDKLRKVDPSTGVITDVTAGALGRPRGIAATASGVVYVADRGAGNNNGTIRKVEAATGTVTVVASGLARPQYVAVDGTENVYFTSLNASSIQRIAAGGGAPAVHAALTSAVTGIDADAAGNVYASDSNNQVWRIAAGTGVKTLFAGSGVAGLGDGGASTSASLSGPGGVSFAGSELYIADALNYRIRRVRSNLGPSAAAGPDQIVEATSPAGATVALDAAASSDPDGDPLSFTWTGPFGTMSGSNADVALSLGTHTVTLTVSDGQISASDTLSVTVQDTIGPVIHYVRSPLPNEFGWNNTPVTITFTCTDSGSGLVALLPAPELVATEGAGQERSFHCADASGNSASLTVSDINIDMTAPSASATASLPANVHGWNNSDVTVTFSATDALSGVASCDPPVVLSSEGAGQSADGSCADLAGNPASATVTNINIDKTAPEVSGSRLPLSNSHGWNNSDVTVSFAATDALSGVGSCEPDVVLSAEGAGQSGSGACVDLAGNTASATVENVNIDKTVPELGFGAPSPAANANGWNNTDVSFAFTASDSLSGIDTTSVASPLVLTAEGSAVSGSVNVTDLAGNSASFTSPVVMIDKSAPQVTGARSPLANAHGWNNTDVTVTFEATDALSGVASCDPAVTFSSEGAGQSASGSCVDLAGNTASATVESINIDKTVPSMSFGAQSPAANANGWNNTDVSFAFTASDGLSGIDSTSVASPLVLTAEGSTVTGSVTVTDLAGNSQVFTSPVVMIDKSAPQVTGARSPLANAHGWNNTDVTVTFEATDALSGVGSCDPAVTFSTEGAGQSADGSCVDLAGNSASVTVGNVNIDKTAPAVMGTPARATDKNGWFNHAVSIAWSGTDALSGVLSCAPDATYSGPDAPSASVPGHCSDRAGNQGTGSVALKYDATAPTVSIVTPPSGAIYTLNQSVAAQYSCADNLSGVETCAGPVPSGSPVSTSPVGSKSFSVSVMDAAGNSGSKTNPYAVQFRFVGFLQPVDNLPMVNVANAGKTVPIKWQLKDASGAALSDLGSVVSLLSAPLACDAAPADIIEEEAAATGGTQLRYDATASQFIYNWSTSKSWAGSCVQIQLTLADGTKQYAKFKFK